jgi:hypothetical protein
MTDGIKREIERLLDEPDGLHAGDRIPGAPRARLAATLSEGLEGASGPASPDIASMAAFLDGHLSGAERDKFVAGLTRQPSLRADLESSAALIEAASDSTLNVPAHLMARASAQFAPAAPPPVQAQPWDLSALLAVFLPQRRLALGLVAALAVMLAVPAALVMLRNQPGGGQPELSGIEEPAKEPTQAEKDKACEEKMKKANAEKAKAGDSTPSATKTPEDDPCDRSKRNSATKK